MVTKSDGNVNPLTLAKRQDVTIHPLYEAYPDWSIDVTREHELLLAHDRIVLQFPFYWYSSPPLLKKWLDFVLLFRAPTPIHHHPTEIGGIFTAIWSESLISPK